MVELPPPSHHGWTDDGDIFWTDEMFPDSLNNFVISEEDENDDEDFEDDIEGDVFDESDEEDDLSDDEDSVEG